MAELYGHQWHSAQGKEPTERWTLALTHYSTDLIAKFISDCETGKHYADWPPSVRGLHIFCRPKPPAHKAFDLKVLENNKASVTPGRIAQLKAMTPAQLKAISDNVNNV